MMAVRILLGLLFYFHIPLGFASNLDRFETLTSVSSGGVAQWLGLNGTLSLDSDQSSLESTVNSNQNDKTQKWGWGVSAEMNHFVQNTNISDLGLFGSVGINWQATMALLFRFDLLFGSVSNEDYQTFGGIFKVEYHLPLYPHLEAKDIYGELYTDPAIIPYDPDDARQFYRHQREELDRESRVRERLRIESEFEARSERVYPDLIFHLNIGVQNDLKKGKASANQPGNTVQGLSLNPIRIGPGLTYAFSNKLSLGVIFDYFIYDSDVDQFTSALKSANSLRIPLFNYGTRFSSGISSLFFPNAVTSAEIKFKLSNRSLIHIQLNQIWMGSLNQNSVLGFSPEYDHDFGINWQVGLGAYLLGGYGNPTFLSGLLHLAYKF